MKINPVTAVTMVLTGLLLAGCATEKRVDPAQPFDMGKLSILPPAGNGWTSKRDDSPSAESVLFLKRGSLESPGLMAAVWQFHADEPVTSDKDLWKSILSPYRDSIDSLEQFEILNAECDHDESFTNVGVMCAIEGRHYVKGDFWVTGMDRVEVVMVRGHGYAFAHPGDNKVVSVIEYAQGGTPEVLSADTEKLLREFGRGITIRE